MQNAFAYSLKDGTYLHNKFSMEKCVPSYKCRGQLHTLCSLLIPVKTLGFQGGEAPTLPIPDAVTSGKYLPGEEEVESSGCAGGLLVSCPSQMTVRG